MHWYQCPQTRVLFGKTVDARTQRIWIVQRLTVFQAMLGSKHETFPRRLLPSNRCVDLGNNQDLHGRLGFEQVIYWAWVEERGPCSCSWTLDSGETVKEPLCQGFLVSLPLTSQVRLE